MTDPNPRDPNFEETGDPSLNFQDDSGKGTEGTGYPKKPDGSVDLDAMTPELQAKYWKEKSDASTKGFHKYKEETDRKITALESRGFEDIENLRAKAADADTITDFEKLIPNFDQYTPEDQQALRNFRNAVVAETTAAFSKDPAIVAARATYNETKWLNGYHAIEAKYPQLKEKSNEFKKLYFKQGREVPDNIEGILDQAAKAFLFDEEMEKAKAKGAEEERSKADRVSIPSKTGGGEGGKSGMTLDDWEELRLRSPQEFARREAEFNKAMSDGSLK